MKLSVDRILNSRTLPIQMFDGYTLCVRNIVNGRVGWSILGFLQEIWIPADCLSLSQLKGYVRLHQTRNKKIKQMDPKIQYQSPEDAERIAEELYQECDPPDACRTHGRCWTHSYWADSPRISAPPDEENDE